MKKSKDEYKEVKKKSKEEQKIHHDECAVKNADRKENNTVENELKQLKYIKRQREQSLRMKNALKPSGKNGVKTLLIPAYSRVSKRNEISKRFCLL